MPIPLFRPKGKLRIADLYCGAGGLSLGARLACEAVGLSAEFVFAADQDPTALEVYSHNFRPRRMFTKSIGSVIDYHVEGRAENARFSYAPEALDFDDSLMYGNVDLLVAGPPCQGHSNLNNHTRGSDPKNSLYLTVPAFAVALGIPRILIENVPEVDRDKSGILSTARGLLESNGYTTVVRKLRATDHGVAQTRTRLFLMASLGNLDNVDQTIGALRRQERPVSWAIGDLVDSDGPDVFDKPSTLDPTNKRRVDWLHDNDEYDLPNEERPDCHRDGHTYKSVYGRMYWDKPAMTLTQGFSVAGRGRFVHSIQKRTLTPHEAARIQGFPDSFRFQTRLGKTPLKTHLVKMIGNAVPPVFGTVCTLALVSDLFDEPTTVTAERVKETAYPRI